jgi:hypothetical protein
MHRRLLRSAPVVVAAALAALLVSALSASASPPPPPKAYGVVIAPATIARGTTTTMTATITDGTAGPLKSLQLIPSAPLTVQSASLPAGMAPPTVTTCNSGAGPVPCVALNSLNLTPGNSVVLTMTVSSPPACSTVNSVWAAAGSKPLDAASSQLTTSVLNGCYSVVMAPATVAGGTSALTMTATVTVGTGRPLASAELIPPAALAVQSASLPTGMSQPTVTTCPSGAGSVPCVALNNLNLAPGASAVVTMNVNSAPACSTVNTAWTSAGSIPLDAANSQLATSVLDGPCHLKFDAQPQSIVVGQPITTAAYTPTGPTAGPFTVDVLDANNQLVTGSAAPVTVTIGQNPGGASLSGSATVQAVGGVASFQGLSLNEQGNGYTLVASSSGMASGTSAQFDAQGQGTQCSGSGCTLTATTTQGSGQVAATGSNATGALVGSVNAPGDAALACGSYQTADPNTYEFFSVDYNLQKVVTLDITDPLGSLPHYDAGDTNGFTTPGGDGDNDYDDVLWNQQICFQAPYPFTQRGGGYPTPVNGMYTGLLPDCTAQITGPCHNRSADSAPRDPASPTGYDIKLVADIPAAVGDPRMN